MRLCLTESETLGTSGLAAYVDDMTAQSSSPRSLPPMLATLRAQVQIQGGPQQKADLRIWEKGLAISWSIGLFGGKAASNPEDIVMGWPNLIKVQVSGLPEAEYAGSPPFARLEITEGSQRILLFSERYGLLSVRPTFSNDPMAFVSTVRVIAACLMADSMRKLESKRSEIAVQAEFGRAIARAKRYVSDGQHMSSFRCNMVFSDGELPGYALHFSNRLCFFDQDDIEAENISDGNPIILIVIFAESFEIQAPRGTALDGQGISDYAESASDDLDFYIEMAYGGKAVTLRVPYSSLPPSLQQDCVTSLSKLLKTYESRFDDDSDDD